jgi:hypothetical protein
LQDADLLLEDEEEVDQDGADAYADADEFA